MPPPEVIEEDQCIIIWCLVEMLEEGGKKEMGGSHK
jgi:hypothetical protein